MQMVHTMAWHCPNSLRGEPTDMFFSLGKNRGLTIIINYTN